MRTYYFPLLLLGSMLMLPLMIKAQNPVLVKDINPGPSSSYFIHLVSIGDKIVFIARNNNNGNYEPWVSDGTTEGTFMIKDINNNPNSGSMSPADRIVVLNNIAYFAADDGVHGRELWKTDGTPEGTQMVLDLNPGSAHANVSNLCVFGDKILFSASIPAYGNEIWCTQGTEESTIMLADLYTGTYSSSPHDFFAGINSVYFKTTTIGGFFHSSGTPATTGIITTEVTPGILSEPYYTIHNQAVYFNGTGTPSTGGGGRQLWMVTPDNQPTRVTNIISEQTDLNPTRITSLGSFLFFAGEQYPHGQELWVNTPENTYMVKDINPSGHANISLIIAFKNKVVFNAWTSTHGIEVWVSDGTAEGTFLFQDINPGPVNSGFIHPKIFDNTLYFTASNGGAEKIWKLNDYDNPAEIFVNIEGGGSSSSEMVKLGNEFLFYGYDPAHGGELWKIEVPQNIQSHQPSASPLKIAPNPAKDNVSIRLSDKSENQCMLRIFDISGKEVLRQIPENTTNIQLNVSHLQPGLYLIKIQGKGFEHFNKLVILP